MLEALVLNGFIGMQGGIWRSRGGGGAGAGSGSNGGGDASPVVLSPAATGGVETLIQDGADYYRVHTFIGEAETLTHTRDVEIEILAVGSGGGASNNSFGSSGGAGGGEVITSTMMLDGDLNISVGQAPAPIRAWELSSTDRVYVQGNPGNDTVITGALAITAEGGNFGGCGHNRDTQLGNGGSSKRGGGGGAGSGQGPSTLCFGGISAGSGNGAGGSTADIPRRAGGGGGYYDAPVIPADAGGDGGHGFLSSITGTPVYYGCGGPGGYRGGTATVGNAAPGGAAIDENGQPGTGNGAGGSIKRYLPPAVGGSGICVIRYKITQAEYEAV